MAKKDKGPVILMIWGAVLIIVAAIAILWGKDDYNGVELNGWDVLDRVYPSFWTWTFICTIAAIAFSYASYATYKGIGWFKNIRGQMVYVWLAAIACILLIAPWGYVGGAKANGGFLLPKKEAVKKLA